MEKPQEYKFDVFISYRHAELDSAVAGYLQRTLEHYHIPREIQKKCGKKNIRRVFRDEEELGVASDLFGQIEQNLIQSEFLLVICSPRILESKWCMREIETFIKYRGRENVLAVLIEGEPETAFPSILTQEGEPLAADLRGRDKREVLRHARQRLPRLVAPLLYCSYDEIYQRHRVYRMRRVMALASVVTAVSLGFGVMTVLQNREISRNYQSKLENQSRYLAQTSINLLESGDRDAALLVALEALPLSSEDTSRPYVAEARTALERALYTYELNYRYQLRPVKLLEHKGSDGSCIDCNEEENVLLTVDTCIYVWDAQTCENICCWEDEDCNYKDAKLVGNHSVAVLSDKGVLCFDYRTSQILWQWEFPVCEECNDTELIWTYDAVSGRILCGRRRLYIHRKEEESGKEFNQAHCFYMLDVVTGKSQSWMPAELYQVLEEGTYSLHHLEENFFKLSPGGERLAVCVCSYTEYPPVYHFFVLETGKDESAFCQKYNSNAADHDTLDKVSWLDSDTLAMVRTLEGGMTLGLVGRSATWLVECWDMDSATLRFSHQDTCMALNKSISVEKVLPEEGRDGTIPLVSIIYDNVAVCLDWETGERYSRVEDRSAIVLDHIWNSNARVIVTADGYLFSTSPVNDMVRAPLYNAYHYYIGLDIIQKAVWCNDRAFFFAGGEIYCYAPVIDDSYTLMEAAPSAFFFSRDSRYLLTLGRDSRLYLYDTGNFELLWQDDCLYVYNTKTAALTDDCFAVYMEEGKAVRIYSVLDDSSVRMELEDGIPLLEESSKWNLRAAGGSNVLAWIDEEISLASYSDFDREDMEHTAVWMINAQQGQVTDQWSYREIMEWFSDEDAEAWTSVSLGAPAATADGRYVLIPFRLKKNLWGENVSEDQQRPEVVAIFVWDREEGQTVALPEDVIQGMAWKLVFGTYFEQDGWVSPTEAAAVLYNEERQCLQVVDLVQGDILHELEVDGIASQEVSFTSDGDHLIFQDARMRLCVYNWKKGEYTQQEITAENGYMRFSFYQDGEVLTAVVKANGLASEVAKFYRRTGEGTYKLDTTVSYCGDYNGSTVVINDENYPRLYHAYTLDELIAQAKVILNGRELTEAERRSYLIE